MKASRKKRSDVDRAVFCTDVRQLFAALQQDRLNELLAISPKQDYAPQMKLAETLRYIANLIYAQPFTLNAAERELNSEAQSLLEAILLGHDHPVWLHLTGLQKVTRGLRPPTTPTKVKRALVLAWVEIMAQARSNDPVAAVVREMDHEGITITSDQVKGWRGRADETISSMVKTIVAEIVEYAASHGQSAEWIARERTLLTYQPVRLNTPPN